MLRGIRSVSQTRSKAQDRVNEFGVLGLGLWCGGGPALSQTAGLPRPTAQSAKVSSRDRSGAWVHTFGRSAEGTRHGARRGLRKGNLNSLNEMASKGRQTDGRAIPSREVGQMRVPGIAQKSVAGAGNETLRSNRERRLMTISAMGTSPWPVGHPCNTRSQHRIEIPAHGC